MKLGRRDEPTEDLYADREAEQAALGVMKLELEASNRLKLVAAAITGLASQPPLPGYSWSADLLAHRALELADATLKKLSATPHS